MKKRKLTVAAALLAVSTGSQAWGPFWDNGGWGNGNGVMDGDFGFSMNASASARGNGWGNSWSNPYGYAPYGYAPAGYGYGPASYAPYGMPAEQIKADSEARREALEAQRKAAMEYQKQMEEHRQAILDAQRQAYERQVAMMRDKPAADKGTAE